MIAGVFDEFFGVPTHPLAVHAPVVLVPIGAIVAVVLAFRPSWRARASWFLPAGVLVLVAMLFVAKESGESARAAKNVFGDVAVHAELAETTFIMSIVWFVVTVGLAGWEWRARRTAPNALSADAAVVGRDPVAIGLAVLSAIAAILTMIWLVRTGHAGAQSRWVL